jgi:2'-5' RNA ligase
MRLFAAIDIEAGVRERIAGVQVRLKEQLNLGRQVTWVKPSHIHLTLKFLGEVPDDQVTRVCDAVRRIAGRYSAFDFDVVGVGVFGRPARVVWAGVSECPELFDLQSDLEKEFEILGWERENRPFAGHLTICRIKTSAAGKQLEQAVRAYENEFFGPVSTSEVVLYQSILGSNGPTYTPVSRAALK